MTQPEPVTIAPAALTLGQQLRLEAAQIFGGHVGYTTVENLIDGTLKLARAIETGEQ